MSADATFSRCGKAGGCDCVVGASTTPPNAEVVRLQAALRMARDFLSHTDFSTGECMCGSSVESHDLGSGHSPVDAGDYQAAGVIEQIDEALRGRGDPVVIPKPLGVWRRAQNTVEIRYADGDAAEAVFDRLKVAIES